MKALSTRSVTTLGSFALVLLAYVLLVRTPSNNNNDAKANGVRELTEPLKASGLEHATFAMGCFWHSEEMFLELNGVQDAVPGYCGGTEKNPDYETVGSGSTGYAESVDVTYDPEIITYRQLLEIFFAEHDPTQLNRQGNDEGPQYRSAIFYRNAEQKKQVDDYIASLSGSHKFAKPIVTQVAPFSTFYRAEDYHIRYVRHHPENSYVAHVTVPELEKFRVDFQKLLKH
jgi:peptide-methionine (S)-S-oxide reductase